MTDSENAVPRIVTHNGLHTVVSGIAKIERLDEDEMESEERV